MSKPLFQSVIDLGLRDVGVRNQPKRLAAHFGKIVVPLLVLDVVSVGALCVMRADAWLILAAALGWPLAGIALAIRTSKRWPVVVVKVSAEGTNQATWLVLMPFVLMALSTALLDTRFVVPLLVITVLMAAILLKGRGQIPEVLRRLRAHLAADESVLGDGIGVAKGVRNRRDAFRLVVATDRRLLVATANGSPDQLLSLDLPYTRVSRFGIDWKYRGRIGELTLTVPGAEGASPETHVITGIAPANLLSIAQALQAHRVPADAPEVVSEAERAWEEARLRGRSRRPFFDRAAMNTREFDRGLWLLLVLSAVVFWVDPIGLAGWSDPTVPVLGLVLVVCLVCGYVSGTSSSIAYVLPLNLLVIPTFFLVAQAGGVILLMIVLSAVGAVGLAGGSGLRRARARRADRPAEPAARPDSRPAPGSLRYALGGLGLTRISGILLAGAVALVAIAAALGFSPGMLRLAVEEATAEQVSVDGRSNLTGNAASLTYTPGLGLKELITDEHYRAGPNDGARWELRSSFRKGYNVVSLAHYIFEPRLDDSAAVAKFVADKDREHSRIAGSQVTHRERVVDGRKGYVWTHRAGDGSWQYAAWFPQPVHTVRLECVARTQEAQFRRLCAEAIRSLEFH